MYPCRVEYKGLVYQTSESAYQAQKCCNYEDKLQLCYLNGYESKALVKKLPKVKSKLFDSMKDIIMYEIVRQKFIQNPDILHKLVISSDPIIEINDHGDKYWGVYNGVGSNKLGIILMTLRSQFKLIQGEYDLC